MQGTGFVHTAPGHGREDFDAWMDFNRRANLPARSAPRIFVGHTALHRRRRRLFFTKDAPGFGPDREGGPARVIDDKGKKGDANKAVIEALIAADQAVRARPAEAHLSA